MPTTSTTDSTRQALDLLTAVCAGIEVDDLPTSEVTELHDLLGRVERLAGGTRTRLLRRLAESTAWQAGGHPTLASYIAATAGISTGVASQQVKLSADLPDLPHLDRALAAGTISTTRAQTITPGTNAMPSAEAALVAAATDVNTDLADLRRRTREVVAAADPDLEQTRLRHQRQRRLANWNAPDGEFHARIQGPAEAGAALMAAIQGHADRAFRAARADTTREPSQAYAFDGLMALVHPAHDRHDRDRDRDSNNDRDQHDNDNDDNRDDNRDPHDYDRDDNRDDNRDRRDYDRDNNNDDRDNVELGDEAQSDHHNRDRDRGPTKRRPQSDGASPRSSDVDPDRELGCTDAENAGERDPAIASGAIATPAPPVDGGAPRRPVRKRAPSAHKVIGIIDVDQLHSDHFDPSDLCHLAGVGPVARSVIVELLGEASAAVLFRKGTVDLAVAHLGRQPTAFQRTALEARDRVCSVVGCGVTKHLEIDHVRDWALTGQTLLQDLDWLCHRHHRAKTRGLIRLTGPPGQRRIVTRSKNPTPEPPP